MADIVQRLRMNAGHMAIVERYTPEPGGLFCKEAHDLERAAADEIERLRAEHCDTSQCHLCRLLRSAADELERLRAENARLTTENGILRQDLAETQDLYDQHRRAHGKVAARLGDTSHALGRAQALIAWIDGAYTDHRPHADIEAAITRWKDEQC